MSYVASIRRDGRGHRGRVRVFLVPLDDDLIRRLEGRIGQEIYVEVESVSVRCRVTRDGRWIVLRPIKDGVWTVLNVLTTGRRFVRLKLQ